MQKVSFSSNGLTIRGVLTTPKTGSAPFPGVICFHGMTSSNVGYIPLIEKLAENGIAGLAINMRGHGESDGDFNTATVTEAINDGLAAYDFLTSQPNIDSNKIGLLGTSVGAILVSFTSQQREIQSIVLRAPAAYSEELLGVSMAATMTNEDHQFYDIPDLSATPPGRAIAKFKGNLLVISSEKDAIIPAHISQGYIDITTSARRKELHTIKDATHALTKPTWKQEFQDTAAAWFVKTLEA